MRRQLILAHLMAMRSAVDALILELTEDAEAAEQRCCAAPCLQKEVTYSGERMWCSNCGTEKASGAVQAT
jgi:hypothetical protein